MKGKKRGSQFKPSKIIILLFGVILFSVFVTISSLIQKPKVKPQVVNTDKVFILNDMPNEPTDRAGIWEYDTKTGIETQLISYANMLNKTKADGKIIDDYASPNLSPSRDKIAFYLGFNKLFEDDALKNSYDLWVYTISSKKLKKILSSVHPPGGYLQSPIWTQDEENLYVTLVEDKKPKLYVVGVNSGYKKKLGKNYNGAFWMTGLLQNYMVFQEKNPNEDSSLLNLGVLNLKTDAVSFISTHSPVYWGSVEEFDQHSLLKYNLGRKGNTEYIEKQGIYDLEKVNLLNKTSTVYPIPKTFTFPINAQRIEPIEVCHKKWALLRVIVPTKTSYFDEEFTPEVYTYNLQNGVLKNAGFMPEIDYVMCDDHNSDTYYEVNTLKITQRSFLDTSYKKLITPPSDFTNKMAKTCLYGQPDEFNRTVGLGFIYVSYQFGNNVPSPDYDCRQDQALQGLYRIDLKEGKTTQIYHAKTHDESQNILYPQ